jgi:hypothetical protein
MEESGEQWKHGGTSFAILKENRLLAVAPPRPVPESRYGRVETYGEWRCAGNRYWSEPLFP